MSSLLRGLTASSATRSTPGILLGILLGLLGTAFAVGEWRALLGVTIAAGAYWRKLTIEEGGMRRRFGAVYADYAARAPALVPFVI